MLEMSAATWEQHQQVPPHQKIRVAGHQTCHQRATVDVLHLWNIK